MLRLMKPGPRRPLILSRSSHCAASLGYTPLCRPTRMPTVQAPIFARRIVTEAGEDKTGHLEQAPGQALFYFDSTPYPRRLLRTSSVDQSRCLSPSSGLDLQDPRLPALSRRQKLHPRACRAPQGTGRPQNKPAQYHQGGKAHGRSH